MTTIFQSIKRRIEKYGLTDEIRQKIELVYTKGLITEIGYKSLLKCKDKRTS